MNFLLWNVGGKDLSQRIALLARYRQIDVFALCEAEASVSSILDSLNNQFTNEYYLLDTVGCDYVHLIARLHPSFCTTMCEDSRFTIMHIEPPGLVSIILAAAHLQSKLFADSADQAGHCEDLASEIARIEDQIGHQRTVLVGDLNQSPFEEGLVSAKGLNAVMCRDVARRGMRTFNKRSYRLFYNPMWSRLGDALPGPPGTYYRTSAAKCETFWHMLDQVLVRPALLDAFDLASLEILTSDGEDTLTRAGNRPSVRLASDHLPLMFSMNL